MSSRQVFRPAPDVEGRILTEEEWHDALVGVQRPPQAFAAARQLTRHDRALRADRDRWRRLYEEAEARAMQGPT